MNGPTEHDSAYYKTLRRNMVLVIVLVSATPLVIIPGIIFHYFEASYREKTLDYLSVLIKKHGQNIDTYLNNKLGDLRFLAKSYPVERMTEDAFLHDQLEALQEEYGGSFVDLGLVNSAGEQVAYAGPFKLKNADYSKARWFKEALTRNDYVSDVFKGLRGQPHFIVAVRRQWRNEPWILRATVDFEEFNSLVQNLRIGTTGFAFILNNQGEYVSKPPRDVAPPLDVYLNFLKDARAPADGVEVVESSTPSGKQVFRVMTRMKQGEWLLCYQQDVADAYALLNYVRTLAKIIFVIGLMVIVGVAIVLSRRIVKKIAEADRQKEMMNEQVIEAGKLASLGELAAGIAHEINNPVAIMVEEAGWIEDILSEGNLTEPANIEEFKRSLTQIKTQGKRCKEITFKLLSFARKTDPTVKTVDLNEIVEDVVALSQNRAKYANVSVVTKLSPELPELRVSPSEMQQVLLNLINNGCDAMEGTGGKIDITTRVSGKHVVVDVADNGPGIPKANLQRIFDPFFTTKPVGKGTGLGLSICYGIIKKLGGELSVNSAIGLGTAFHVHIPIAASEGNGKRSDQINN